MNENTTEKERELLNLVREARTRVYKMTLTTDKQEREKIREQLKKVLFDIGKVYVIRAFYAFLSELENGEGVDLEYKEKYAPLEYRSLGIIKGLDFKG